MVRTGDGYPPGPVKIAIVVVAAVVAAFVVSDALAARHARPSPPAPGPQARVDTCQRDPATRRVVATGSVVRAPDGYAFTVTFTDAAGDLEVAAVSVVPGATRFDARSPSAFPTASVRCSIAVPTPPVPM